ncbi:MAG: substrate-binding domain-containing protein [Asticcacaulis sp.]|nr:substrate-binding domain-containing protein [Asticcacaulis sp.]
MTLDDVAKRVGVSSITVSRAFRRPDKVADEVRQRIQRVADEMGYVSNRAASSLASARSMNIVVLVPSLRNMVFVETLDGVEKALRPKGYQMLLGVTNYSPEEEEALVRAYLAFDPDGILLTGMNYRESTRRLIENVRVPVVHMMELSDRDGVYSVGFSQEAAAEAMTEHLLSQGRRRIAFVASQLDARTLARSRGYRDTLIRAGLYEARRELLVPDPSSVALGGILLARILQQAPDIDAIFFCNDDLAQGGLFECLRRGIAVPDQLAIGGFNDLPSSACTVPALTSVATPRFETGVRAADMLLTLIDGRPVTRPHVDLGFVLKPREST